MQANTGHSQNNQNQGGQNQKPSLSWSQPATPQSAASTPPAITAAPNRTSQPVPEKSYAGAYIGIFVGGIIIGTLVGWGITRSHNAGSVAALTASSTAAAHTGTSTSTTEMPSNSSSASVDLSGSTVGSPNIFTVASPQTAGFAVVVSNLLVSQPTWVVIYEDHAGVPGNALGAELFLPQSQGTAQSGTVELLRGTLPGQTYFAGEALDDGDKIFSLINDKTVRDAQGNPILVQFTTK